MSLPPEPPPGSVKEVLSANLERDPDQDSLDSDSLGGDDGSGLDQPSTDPAPATPQRKCFIDAAELGDGECARPDVLPPPPSSSPPADLVTRRQHEEKLKGSLLFNGSGCSTPEVLLSPQRRPAAVGEVLPPHPSCGVLPEDGCPQQVQHQPDVVSTGAADQADTGAAGSREGSPARRALRSSLDEVPIVAGHHEPTTPPAEPPRRAPDPQTVFFVDLNTLPAPVEPPPAARPPARRESDAVYLYIDLNKEQPTRAAGDTMSVSYHGATVASQRTEPTGAEPDVEEVENPTPERPGGRSLFYTVGGTEAPRRPPPELKPRPPRQEKRRRNLSLDCQAGAEAAPPAAGAAAVEEAPPPAVTQRRSPAGRASQEPARRPPRCPAPEQTRARASGRRPPHTKPAEGSPPAQVTSSEPTVARHPRVNSAPPRRRSAQRPEPRRRERPAAQPEPPKPQRTFLKSHSGRNAVSLPPARAASATAAPRAAPVTSSSSGGGGGSAGTLTRRKVAAAAARQPAQPPPVSSPRDSPASDDNGSDVSSKSYHRQSPESRNKQGIDQLTSDMLQMLSDGLYADVTIQVAGQEVAAHRCVLAARCQYFRELLSKPQHNVVRIDGHKLETVEFMLFHLYSGAMYVPEDVDLSDLLTLSVMLAHKQLIRMAEFAMRVRLCHMFHKPCSECIPGVLETLCTAADCDLDDLAARCLAWVTQNRVAVWADPSFSEISDEYRAWCFQEAATLSQETVLSVVQDCRRLSQQLPAVRWAAQVRDMVDTLLSNAVVYLSRHLGAILVSDRFLSLAERGECCQLEQYILAAADVQNSADAHTSLEVIGQLQAVPNHGWDQLELAA